jgi:hypothetical protein
MTMTMTWMRRRSKRERETLIFCCCQAVVLLFLFFVTHHPDDRRLSPSADSRARRHAAKSDRRGDEARLPSDSVWRAERAAWS